MAVETQVVRKCLYILVDLDVGLTGFCPRFCQKLNFGAIFDKTGSHWTGVDMIEPEIVRIAELSWLSTSFM